MSRPCKPYISGWKNADGVRHFWTWTLECDHDIQASGPFHELILIANDHVRRQLPAPPERPLWEMPDRFGFAPRLVMDDDLMGEPA